MLAERARRLTPSPTLAIAARARAMRAQGIDVLSFSAGEPDFDTPERVKAAAVRALARGADQVHGRRRASPSCGPRSAPSSSATTTWTTSPPR